LFGMLQQRNPNLFGLSVSCTTRGPRQGEVDGKHYYFVSMEEFTKVSILIVLQIHTEILKAIIVISPFDVCLKIFLYFFGLISLLLNRT